MLPRFSYLVLLLGEREAPSVNHKASWVVAGPNIRKHAMGRILDIVDDLKELSDDTVVTASVTVVKGITRVTRDAQVRHRSRCDSGMAPF